MLKTTSLLLALLGMAFTGCNAQSVYTLRPDDPQAIFVSSSDGTVDSSATLQAAIDRAQETLHHGIVFIPEGRYRLDHTVYVWAGIRLIGYGARRPLFVLGTSNPEFQSGPDHYMIWFTDERTAKDQPIADASEFTFYSALSNIDFELEAGNPAAVAIRFNVAQHSFVSHARFRLGSARAAIEAVGNQANDLQVEGGEYGIITGKTSPAWQFLLMDSTFEGQRTAAIRTHDAGFTLVRDRIVNAPVAVQIPEGEVEQLYGRDLQLERISHAGLELGNTKNLRSEITLENLGCSHVAGFSDGVYPHFRIGLTIGRDGRERGIESIKQEPVKKGLLSLKSDIPRLPAMDSWVNVQQLGIKGGLNVDETEAIQRAIDTHATLYFPSGVYHLSGTLHLRADTTLIGFSPYTTQFVLSDQDPRFQGDGPAVPLLISPPGGKTVVTGFGIATGNGNSRAAGVEWRAGDGSLLEDVEFIRWHNGRIPFVVTGTRPTVSLDDQYPSLWVHDGGGGIFRGIWSHAGTAKAGLLVENTETPSIIYQFSCEHHMRKEVRLDHVSHWRIYDLQTEEEKPEGADAVALEIESSHDVLLANTYMYRVSRNVMPKLYAVSSLNSAQVTFENVKVFSQTRLAFDNTIFDEGSGVLVRAHDFTHLELAGDVKAGAPLPLPAAFPPNGTLARLATGFSNASGLTSDKAGTVYFSDAATHTVYRYSEEHHAAEVLAKTDQSPQVLGFVAPSTLLAINNEKSLSRIDLATGEVSSVAGVPAPVAGTVLLLPVGLHNELVQLQWLLQHVGYTYRVGSNTALRSALMPQPQGYFYAPDGKTAILAGGTWRPLLQTSQLVSFALGDKHYLVSEDDGRSYLGQLDTEETLTTKVFAERGGTSVISDQAGNVYIASGQVYIYDRDGKQMGVLEVPERPTSLCFGGSDHRTLYIGARSSLYAIQVVAGD